jgi:hypothetical protein
VTTSFPTSVCASLDRIAAANGLTRAEVVQFGIVLLDLMAASSDPATTPLTVVTGPCEVEVTWDAEDLALLERAGAAWGLGRADLHNAGGRLLVALVHWFAVNG